MESPVISDFNLDSEGRCFFCLKKVSGKFSNEATAQFPKCSVHYLTRYLKMDMGRVLNDEGQIDLTLLLTKVRRSRLKVELCEKCTSLNDTFSGLYRQLEKLEIEINFNVRLIQEQLLGAERSDKTPTTLAKFSLNSSRRSEVFQIVDVLREEAIKKCSQKLRVVSPQVKINKLSKKQIDAEVSRRPTSSNNNNKIKLKTSPEDSIHLEGNFKTEFGSPNDNLLLDDNSRNYDMDIGVANEEDIMKSDITNGPMELLQRSNLETEIEVNKTSNSSVIISAPTTNTVDQMGFNSRRGFHNRVRSVHEKNSFRCAPCGKEFARRYDYNRHHQSVHVGVKFKCLNCNKLFSLKTNLRAHQRKTCCEKGKD